MILKFYPNKIKIHSNKNNKKRMIHKILKLVIRVIAGNKNKQINVTRKL